MIRLKQDPPPAALAGSRKTISSQHPSTTRDRRGQVLRLFFGVECGNDMISTDSIVAAREEQLTSKLDRESIVLQMDSGKYFGFEAVGQRIWELVQQPRRVSEIRDAVAAEYDVDPDKCERDLLTFLQQMQAAGLIEVQDA